MRPGGLGEFGDEGAAGLFAAVGESPDDALNLTAVRYVLAATTPVITQFVRWARDGVRPSPALLGLSAAAFLGVGLVITRGRLDGLEAIGGGELMMLGAVVSWALYAHGSSRFPSWSPLRYTTLTAVGGTVAIVAATAIADAAGWQHVPTGRQLLGVAPQLAYLVLIAAVAAVLAMNTGARRLGPANAALFMNLVPVVTFAVQIVRGYRPLAVEIAGAALTVAALVAANGVLRRGPAPAQVTHHIPVSPAALLPAVAARR